MTFDTWIRIAVAKLNFLHPDWSREKCMERVRMVPPKHFRTFLKKLSKVEIEKRRNNAQRTALVARRARLSQLETTSVDRDSGLGYFQRLSVAGPARAVQPAQAVDMRVGEELPSGQTTISSR